MLPYETLLDFSTKLRKNLHGENKRWWHWNYRNWTSLNRNPYKEKQGNPMYAIEYSLCSWQFTAIQEILWFHGTQKPTTGPFLSQLNPGHTFISYFSWSILILSSHPYLNISSFPFIEVLKPKWFTNFLLHATYYTHLIVSNFITITILGKQHKSYSS